MAETLGTAVLELEVDSSGLTRGLEKSFSQAERSAGRFGSALSRGLGRTLTTVGKSAVVAGAALGTGFAAAVAVGTKSLIEHEKANAQISAALKSTGNAAKTSLREIDAHAASIERLSGIDDVAVKRGAALLLTFKNIRNEAGQGNDIFNQTTKIMADLSVAMDQDMKTSAIQLGKALNDPVRGVTALQRVGITFTEAQRDQIKAMVEAGDVMGAQKLILKELESQFGGSAAALGDTFAGKVEILKARMEGLSEQIAEHLMPHATRFLDFLNNVAAADSFGEAIRRFSTGIRELGGDIFGAIKSAVEGVDWVSLAGTIGDKLASAARAVGNFITETDWREVGGKVVDALGAVLGKIDWGAAFSRVFTLAGALAEFVIGAIRNINWSAVGSALLEGLRGAFQGITGLFDSLGFEGAFVAIGGAAVAMSGTIVGAVDKVKGAFTGLFGLISKHPLIAAALAVGTLVSALSRLGGEVERGHTVFERFGQALRDTKSAMDAMNDSTNRVRDANLAREAAELAVERAIRNRNEIEKTAGKNSLEYREAQQAVREAFRQRQRAAEDLAEAQEDLSRAEIEHEKAQLRANQALRDTIEISQGVLRNTGNMSAAVSTLTTNVGTQLTRALQAGNKEFQNAALAALALTEKLGRVPTMTEVKALMRTEEAERLLATFRRNIEALPPTARTDANFVTDAAMRAIDRFKGEEGLASIPPAGERQGERTSNRFAAGIRGGYGEVSEALGGVVSRIRGQGDNAAAAGSSLGSRVASGIASGIFANAGAVISAVTSVVGNALTNVDIPGGSPPGHAAAEFVGTPIAEGIAGGILQGAPGVEGAIQSLGQRALAAVRNMGQAVKGEAKNWMDLRSMGGGPTIDYLGLRLPAMAGGGRIGVGRGWPTDDVLIRVARGEAVVNPLQIQRLGGPDAFRRAGVPGFSTGGIVDTDIGPVDTDPGPSEQNVDGTPVALDPGGVGQGISYGTFWRGAEGWFWSPIGEKKWALFHPGAKIKEMRTDSVPPVTDGFPHVGPAGAEARGHPLSFPWWNQWWRAGQALKFAKEYAKRARHGPKWFLEKWAKGHPLAAKLLTIPTETMGDWEHWPWNAHEPSGGHVGPTPQITPLTNTTLARVARAKAYADQIAGLGQDYVPGGGHGGWDWNGPFDCSGFVSAILHFGLGLLSAPATTYGLVPGANGLLAGPGRFITGYTRNTSDPWTSHTFLSIGGQQYESGGARPEPNGAGRTSRSTAGFTPWHPKGYAMGGVVGRDGRRPSARDIIPILARRGELIVTPEEANAARAAAVSQASTGPLVNIERLEAHDAFSEERLASALGRKLAIYAP